MILLYACNLIVILRWILRWCAWAIRRSKEDYQASFSVIFNLTTTMMLLDVEQLSYCSWSVILQIPAPKYYFMPDTLTTEQKIHRAAIDVFTRKGYAGTKTRDIADAAGINVATLHYYHRTKDQLFQLVAKESMEEFSAIFYEVFKTGLPLKDKIHKFVEDFTELFRRKPHLSTFCLMESERNIEMFKEIVDFRQSTLILEPQLKELIANGEIRPIETPNFVSALVGMTIYPFITRASIFYANDLDEAGYQHVLEEQKRIVPEMIINYLWEK